MLNLLWTKRLKRDIIYKIKAVWQKGECFNAKGKV